MLLTPIKAVVEPVHGFIPCFPLEEIGDALVKIGCDRAVRAGFPSQWTEKQIVEPGRVLYQSMKERVEAGESWNSGRVKAISALTPFDGFEITVLPSRGEGDPYALRLHHTLHRRFQDDAVPLEKRLAKAMKKEQGLLEMVISIRASTLLQGRITPRFVLDLGTLFRDLVFPQGELAVAASQLGANLVTDFNFHQAIDLARHNEITPPNTILVIQPKDERPIFDKKKQQAMMTLAVAISQSLEKRHNGSSVSNGGPSLPERPPAPALPGKV